MRQVCRFYRLIASAVIVACAGCPSASPPDGATGVEVPIERVAGLSQPDVLSTPAVPACVETGQPETTTLRAMLDALNLYRVNNGLKPLVYSRSLETAADGHLQDLYLRNYFEHVNPDGENPGDRALDAGFCHRYVGENIAAGQISVPAVMEAWENSPGHNANMLTPDYVYVGTGFFRDPTGRMYWGQEFALDVP